MGEVQKAAPSVPHLPTALPPLEGAEETDETRAQQSPQSFLQVLLPICLHPADHLARRKQFFAFDTKSREKGNWSLGGSEAIEPSQPSRVSDVL